MKPLIYILLTSSLFAEIPKHIRDAHLKCIESRLVTYGEPKDTTNSYAIVAAARYCEMKKERR